MRRLAAPLALASLLVLAGCRHRQPKLAAAVPLPPDIHPVMVSVPPPTHPTEPLPEPEKSVVQEVIPPPPPPKKVRKKRAVPVPPAPAAPVQVAAATPPISLGQLSAGGDAGSALRSETEQLAAAQKQRLDHLPAPLAAAHTTEVDQVRRFLKGADSAWQSGDVEGAHTLALKAKILLDDLLR